MNIAIYIYDDAEVLDFSGPFEVFSTAKRLADNNWQVFFVAEHAGPIIARAGFSVNPHYSFADHPAIDLLIVVGGIHTHELEKPAVINWIRETAGAASKVASVCTGAFFTGQSGFTRWFNSDYALGRSSRSCCNVPKSKCDRE